MNQEKIAIIGGGAAGFFAAINWKIFHPNDEVHIFEKSKETLAKVRISGGGRCNVTNSCSEIQFFAKNYPRGEKIMRVALRQFNNFSTINWFEENGVPLKTESDGRVFPKSDSSSSIINCFYNLAEEKKIKIHLQKSVISISKNNDLWQVKFKNDDFFEANKVIFAVGGNSKSWHLLENLGHSIVTPIPSLFSFITKDTRFRNLSGVSVQSVKIKLSGTKMSNEGAILVTHTGITGPAVLKLSAFAARELFEKNYKFNIRIDWKPEISEDEIRNLLQDAKINSPKLQIQNFKDFGLPKRLFQNLLVHLEVPLDKIIGELSNKSINQITESLKNSEFYITGKNTNKDEFVTSGGVKLSEVNFKKFESKFHKNLFIVGECLDIDAITGGFNFQAAWTGGYIVAKNS